MTLLPRLASLLWRGLAGCLLVTTLCGCSGFGREWRAAARQPAQNDPLAGRWEGRWVSAVNGHTGRLRAVLSPTGEHTYRARFHARYAGLFTFGYTVQLQVTREASGAAQFTGEADLGKLAGGVYRYTGRADATRFLATYESRADHGRFEMGRPEK
jgi:hypothetical protein